MDPYDIPYETVLFVGIYLVLFLNSFSKSSGGIVSRLAGAAVMASLGMVAFCVCVFVLYAFVSGLFTPTEV